MSKKHTRMALRVVWVLWVVWVVVGSGLTAGCLRYHSEIQRNSPLKDI